MKYTKIPTNTFKNLQLNAGILLSTFNPQTASIADSNIFGATSGGVNFTAVPSFTDFGEDIDNCPKNTMELKKLESWEIKMSGTYASVTAELAKNLAGVADESNGKITLRNDVNSGDFKDIWWVGDYSDVNDEDSNAGFIAIRMINALSTGGFQIQSGDKAKGQFSFEYTAHYSMTDPDEVPCEIYVKAGSSEE